MDDSLRISLPEPVLSHAEGRRFVGTRRFYPARDAFESIIDGLTRQAEQAAPMVENVPGRVDDATTGLMLGMFSRADGFEYVCGAEVLPDIATDDRPDGMVAVDVPPGRYLAFPTTLEDMQKTVYTVWFEWLPGSPYEAAGAGEVPDYIERYDERFDPETGSGIIEVLFPIQD